jgi:rSAM/selenodomain-associated transferase 2
MQKTKPRYSIIIPVLNEAEIIQKQIQNLRTLNGNGSCEIIVVDGAPEQETIQVLKSSGVRTLAAPRGRAVQMNVGAAQAQGEILVFLHADTELPRDALSTIDDVVQSGCVAGAFDLTITSSKQTLKIIEFGANLRTHITGIPYGDQALFMKRHYFEEIGGYKKIPLMEDIDIMRRIKRAGGKICILPERVQTSPRRWETEGAFYCTLRNWLLAILFACKIPAEKLERFFPHGRAFYRG